jgi:autotransporter-associated beta strand protein
MKRLTTLVAASLLLAIGISTSQAANWYFDQNDDVAGSGVASQVYNWTLDGSGAGPGFWNTNNADGTQASPGLNTALWVNGNDAVFSAGTDAAGVTYGLAIGAGVTANSIHIEEGTVQIASGQVNVGTGSLTIDANASLKTIASSQFATGLTFKLKGTSTTDAAHIQGANASSAGSLLTVGSGLSTVEIDGFGRISYDDADGVPDNKVSIMSSQVITGVGGTPSNGGAGTLVKSGPDQIGYAVKDTGGGVMNFTLNSFKYLRVEQGAFRLRNTGGVMDERLFGAVPLAELADAITLDGGGIGSNLTVTLNAFRGITIGPNGGYFDHGATAGMTMPGPLSGAGELSLGSPTSTATNNVTFTLSHANNVNSFTGGLTGYRATLQLNSSLKVAHLQDGSTTQQPTNQSTITIGTGNTLTVNGGGGSTWSRPIGGAGGFTKMGAGTQNLTGVNTYTGDTKVEGGTLSITNAYLADAADVYLTTGSIFDLAFAATDTIDQLFIDNVAQAAGTWGGAGSGATNISALLSGTGILSVTTGPVVGVPGDFNNDGAVTAGDYVTWRKNEVANNPLPNDNSVGNQAARYSLWRANFVGTPGAGSGGGLSGGGAVPEPTTIGLVLIGLAALGCGRRGRIA